MRDPGLLRVGVAMVLVVAWSWAGAQDAPAPAKVAALATGTAASNPATPTAVSKVATPVTRPVSPAPGSDPVQRRQRDLNMRFSTEKPVLGLPMGTYKSKAHCSVDGTAFYDASTDQAQQDVYGISLDGGVKHLLRKLPIDFTNVWVRDFFAGDGQLVTLLQGDEREGTQASPSPATKYFMALEDEAGDQSELVQIATRFRPVKVARFGSGQALVLGWDEGNLLPVLAYVNQDGTVRRFVDFDERKHEGESEAKAAAEQEKVTLDVLQGASFVGFGSEVMLTYPGTRKPVRVLSAYAEPRTVPITIPAGYVLNDILATDSRWTMVLRVREASDTGKPSTGEEASVPKMRLYEVDATHGSLIRELIPDKPAVSDMTCAPGPRLSAIFYDVLPDASASGLPAGQAQAAATQLVVATARR